MTPLLSNHLPFRLKAIRMNMDTLTLNYFPERSYWAHVVHGFTLLESDLYHRERELRTGKELTQN